MPVRRSRMFTAVPVALLGAVCLATAAPLTAQATSQATPRSAGHHRPTAADGQAPKASLFARSQAARAAADGVPPIKLPAHREGMPAPAMWGKAIDPPGGYEPQVSCGLAAMKGVRKFRALALGSYANPGVDDGITRPCSVGGVSEHYEGRAWDWGLPVTNPATRRTAANFLAWVTAPGPDGQPGGMARRLGIMYLIYDHKIWGIYRASEGWRAYTGFDPHTSHIHISFTWNGARGHTSFWTGHVWPVDYGRCPVFRGNPAPVTHAPRLRPCDAPAIAPRTSSRPTVWYGSTGGAVSDGQRLLGARVTGVFDRATRRAVLAYQRSHDLPTTGALDKTTWANLAPHSASTRLQLHRFRPAKAAHKARSDLGSPVVRRRDGGLDVWLLQQALRMRPRWRTGYYGPETQAAVRAVRQAHGLPKSPLVTRAVWNLLPTPPGTSYPH